MHLLGYSHFECQDNPRRRRAIVTNSIRLHMTLQVLILRRSRTFFAICSACEGRILIAIGGELRTTSRGRRFVNASGKFCCTADMKRQTSKNWRSILISILWTRLTLENWRAKLVSLLLAIAVWYLIKKNVETTSSVSGRPSPTSVTETR